MDIRAFADNTGYAPKSERYHAIDYDTYDGAEDSSNRCTVGHGVTEAEAIADLLEIMLDDGEITHDECREAMRHFGGKPYIDPDYARE